VATYLSHSRQFVSSQNIGESHHLMSSFEFVAKSRFDKTIADPPSFAHVDSLDILPSVALVFFKSLIAPTNHGFESSLILSPTDEFAFSFHLIAKSNQCFGPSNIEGSRSFFTSLLLLFLRSSDFGLSIISDSCSSFPSKHHQLSFAFPSSQSFLSLQFPQTIIFFSHFLICTSAFGFSSTPFVSTRQIDSVNIFQSHQFDTIRCEFSHQFSFSFITSDSHQYNQSNLLAKASHSVNNSVVCDDSFHISGSGRIEEYESDRVGLFRLSPFHDCTSLFIETSHLGFESGIVIDVTSGQRGLSGGGTIASDVWVGIATSIVGLLLVVMLFVLWLIVRIGRGAEEDSTTVKYEMKGDIEHEHDEEIEIEEDSLRDIFAHTFDQIGTLPSGVSGWSELCEPSMMTGLEEMTIPVNFR
jgi:hypothetical protein